MWDIWGVGDFCRAFCCWRAGFFLCWGSVRSIPRLAPSVHAEDGGLGTGGLFYFFTDSFCRRSRVARRRGGGGVVRQDDFCCDVPREVALCRPRNGPSGARETRYVSYRGQVLVGLGEGWFFLEVLLPLVDDPLSSE